MREYLDIKSGRHAFKLWHTVAFRKQFSDYILVFWVVKRTLNVINLLMLKVFN